MRDDPWRSVLAATERHVQLVIVGGRPVYGNRSLLERAGVRGAEPITVAGIRRAVVMDLPEALLPTEPDLRAEATKSWRTGMQELDAVWKDPGQAVRNARRLTRVRCRAVAVRARPARTGRRRSARAHRRRARPAGDADVRRDRSHRRLVRTGAAVVSRPCRDPVRPRRRVLTDVRRHAQPRAIIRSVSASRRASARNMLIAI